MKIIKFIDNALKKSYKVKSLFTTYEYENSQSDVKLYLPAKIKDGLLMQSENMALRLTPVNSSEAKVRLKEFTFAGDTQSVAEYPNAFGEGAHLQYAAISGGLDNTIKVQCVFASRARRVRFVARSLKYARYVFAHAPRGHQRALKAKISDRREGGIFRFCKAAGRRNTGRILRTTTQQNRTIHTF